MIECSFSVPAISPLWLLGMVHDARCLRLRASKSRPGICDQHGLRSLTSAGTERMFTVIRYLSSVDEFINIMKQLFLIASDRSAIPAAGRRNPRIAHTSLYDAEEIWKL